MPELPLPHHAPLGPFAGTRIGVSPLASRGQAATMSKPAVTSDIHESLDVHGKLFPQIPLDPPLGIDDFRNVGDLFLGEVLYADLGSDFRFLQNGSCPHVTDAENAGQTDIDSLVPR
jgi:hypothetical protein